MSYSKLILRDSAEIVWPLDDIAESSSASKAINFFTDNPNSYSASINPANTNLLKNPIVFGGGTLLSFTSSAVGLSIPALGRFSELYDNKDSTLSFWFQTSSLPTIESPIFKKRGSDNIGLFIKNNYLMFRSGTSASYNEIAVDFVNTDDPHHIIISRNRNAMTIILDGIPYTSGSENIIRLGSDNNFSINDYIDFYGPPDGGSWNIDTPALYPNALSPGMAKRHYVYGLGKSIPDKIFYSRGGNIYNSSTIYTNKVFDISWDYAEEWALTEIVDLNNGKNGITPLIFTNPSTFSFDNNLDTTNNKYKFSSSASATKASYIQVDSLSSKLNTGEYPFLVKFKLDGSLPDTYLSQRLISIGRTTDDEIIKFDLYNNNNIHQVRVTSINNSSSITFNIDSISSSPSFYLGLLFNGVTKIIFCQTGSAMQTASFSYLSASGFGADPLSGYIPFPSESVIRIGSSLVYDGDSFNSNVYGVDQFLGSFERFIVLQPTFSASSNFSYIENYKEPRYEFIYDTQLERFKLKTYGRGSFNIHSSSFAEDINDDTKKIGSNYINVGYPNLESSSAVSFTTTLISYTGSIVHGPVPLNENNYLNYLNNVNLQDQYLKFDFSIYAEDSYYYPPKIKYFKMQTFKIKDGGVELKDDAGPDYKIYLSSSSYIYLPEIKYTPSIFMKNNSGIKIQENYVDFTENILPKPLDPRTIPGLKLWLDCRFINGLNKTMEVDDSRITFWTDLSENNNHAIQNNSASAPVFRSQSSNLLRMNQLDGGELNQTSYIIPFNSTIDANINGAVSGTRGIQINPTGSSTDSYIDVSLNTASLSTFPNQSYTIVGSIKLDKPQTASALNQNSRKIIVLNETSGGPILAASSNAATNARGIYSLSATFSTGSNTIGSTFKFYNGSFDSQDIVYWDNLGVYPISSASPTYSWILPLTNNDRPTLKFNGQSTMMLSTASTSNMLSLYIVARNFGDSIFVQDTSASILYSNSGSYYTSFGSPKPYALSNNKFHIFSILQMSSSYTHLYIDGDYVDSQNVGLSGIDQLIIGGQLKGDISAVLLFDQVNSNTDRQRIESWLSESFSIPVVSEEQPISYYSASYSNEY